ncbi:winged helix-turn-helix domain-containing protein [Haloferax namakaokahaiae]|uniref:Winged helix-turn-helix domain-containing protein n=1 Tax=Haloferax namakaokahaiae TaxID=1748331 RepID=A0ABD5ZFH2_9EURY
MSEAWNAAGYIASSRYRLAVCEYLDENGSGLPSRIASDTGLAQPHVSRALSELREKNIVELLVPESQQKGRLYGLTDLGVAAYKKVAVDRLGELAVVEPTEFPNTNLVTELTNAYAGQLRGIVWCEPDQTWVCFTADELSRDYDTETLKALVSTLTNGEPVDTDTGGGPAGDIQFVVYGLEDALIVRVQLDSETDLLVSVELGFDESITELAESCQEVALTAPIEGRVN